MQCQVMFNCFPFGWFKVNSDKALALSHQVLVTSRVMPLCSRRVGQQCVMPMQNLSRRGLHGTALEYAKLLLGLDPSDPRGVLFCIDYLAIRAHQYKFLKVRLFLKLSMLYAFCHS